MAAEFIRIWKEINLDEVAQHLLVVGDLSGDCYKCRHIGIDYANARACPACNTQFKYIATRRASGSAITNMRQIGRKRPDLVFIDFNDFKSLSEKDKARNFFKDNL